MQRPLPIYASMATRRRRRRGWSRRRRRWFRVGLAMRAGTFVTALTVVVVALERTVG